MIKFKYKEEVYLEDTLVGHIEEVEGGFQYVPINGKDFAGGVYATVEEVKAIL